MMFTVIAVANKLSLNLEYNFIIYNPIRSHEFSESSMMMSLQDYQIDYYVIKEDWWNWGSGDIYNQAGTAIARMHRRALSLRAFTEVTNLNGQRLFSVERKIVSLRPSFVLKDEQGETIGRTNRKLLTLFRPKLWLEDARGQRLLEAQGNFLGKDFQIKTAHGQPVARVAKSDFFRDLFLGGSLFDYSDTYAVKINDVDYDKRLLLGFVIAIDNSVHDDD
jgi:uncharacterized protein YxjI